MAPIKVPEAEHALLSAYGNLEKVLFTSISPDAIVTLRSKENFKEVAEITDITFVYLTFK